MELLQGDQVALNVGDRLHLTKDMPAYRVSQTSPSLKLELDVEDASKYRLPGTIEPKGHSWTLGKSGWSNQPFKLAQMARNHGKLEYQNNRWQYTHLSSIPAEFHENQLVSAPTDHAYRHVAKAFESIGLQPGMVLYFNSNTYPPPCLTVKDIVPLGPHSSTLKLNYKNPEADSSQDFHLAEQTLLGRAEECDIRIDANGSSRQHGILRRNGNQWYFDMLGSKKMSVISPHSIEVLDRRDFTLSEQGQHRVGTLKDLGSDSNLDSIRIVDGMEIQIHPYAPTYKAHITKAANKNYLYLGRVEKTDPERYPDLITVEPGMPVILGREHPHGYHGEWIPVPLAGVSATHASIAWDEMSKEFLYHPLGKFPPRIRLPQLLDSLEKKYSDLTIDPDSAKRQLAEITQLQKEIRDARPAFVHVQHGELDTQYIPDPKKWEPPANTDEMQKGYQLWLRAYELLYREELKPRQSTELKNAAHIIDGIGKDWQRLDRLAKTYNATGLEKGPRADAVHAYVEEKLNQLKREGILFLPGGYQGHHAVACIRRKGGEYTLTVYNAGAEAEPTDREGYVHGIAERVFKNSKKPYPVIWGLTEKKMWTRESDVGKQLASAIPKALGDEIIYSHEVRMQGRGNCASRSTRELLRDSRVLDPELFEKVHKHVADPEHSSPDDMIAALEMKRQKLAKLLKIDLPAPITTGTISNTPPGEFKRPETTMHANHIHSPKNGLSNKR